MSGFFSIFMIEASSWSIYCTYLWCKVQLLKQFDSLSSEIIPTCFQSETERVLLVTIHVSTAMICASK